MQKHARPMLPVLMEKLVASFHQQPHSCFLYLCASVVSVFGDSTETADQAALSATLGNLTQYVCAEGSGLLSVADKFAEIPDVVEDFFDFAARFCRHCPGLILHQQSELLRGISICGMKGLNCSHKQATRSLLDFFERALSLGGDERKWGAAAIASQQPAIQAIFRPIGQPFVSSLLHGVARGLPYDRCREAGDVIFLLRKCFGQATACEADLRPLCTAEVPA